MSKPNRSWRHRSETPAASDGDQRDDSSTSGSAEELDVELARYDEPPRTVYATCLSAFKRLRARPMYFVNEIIQIIVCFTVAGMVFCDLYQPHIATAHAFDRFKNYTSDRARFVRDSGHAVWYDAGLRRDRLP